VRFGFLQTITSNGEGRNVHLSVFMTTVSQKGSLTG